MNENGFDSQKLRRARVVGGTWNTNLCALKFPDCEIFRSPSCSCNIGIITLLCYPRQFLLVLPIISSGYFLSKYNQSWWVLPCIAREDQAAAKVERRGMGVICVEEWVI